MADFKTNPKFLDTFYKVDVEECKRFGERSYKKYVNNISNSIIEKKFDKRNIGKVLLYSRVN
jgi:hypothetical protein